MHVVAFQIYLHVLIVYAQFSFIARAKVILEAHTCAVYIAFIGYSLKLQCRTIKNKNNEFGSRLLLLVLYVYIFVKKDNITFS